MALITQIRSRMWLVVTLIALGLLLFVVMDMFSGQTSFFGSQQSTIASVNGQNLDQQKFSNDEQILYSGNTGGDNLAQKDYMFNQFVEKVLIREVAENAGFAVGKAELNDLQFGDNLSPLIQQRLFGQQPVDRNQLNQLKSQLANGSLKKTNPNMEAFWKLTEEDIITDRLKAKVTGAVEKAVYTPKWQAEMLHALGGDKMDLAFVRVPFDAIPDTEVKVADSDIDAYIQKHKDEYERKEEGRRVDLVAFRVRTSAQDSADITGRLMKKIEEFRTTTNDSNFVDLNGGAIPNNYFKKKDLPAKVADTLMRVPVGTVVGPFLDNKAFQLVKVLERQVLPDSVDCRHILVSAQKAGSDDKAKSLIDSLKNLLATGQASFDSLVVKYSEDQGSVANGGKYENVSQGMMMPEFDKYLFVTGKKGQFGVVKTSYGYHLVEVLDQRFTSNESRVKLAILSEKNSPSIATIKAQQQQVQEFLSKNRTLQDLAANSKKMGMEVMTSEIVDANDYQLPALGSGANAHRTQREIIRWAFSDDAELGAVAKNFFEIQEEEGSDPVSYVVAGLRAIIPAGLPKAADMKDQLEPIVKQEKKGEILAGKIKSTDLTAIANEYKVKIDSLQGATLLNSQMSGSEPKVIGTAFGMGPGKVSKPIIGFNGVYVVGGSNLVPIAAPTNLKSAGQMNEFRMKMNLTQGVALVESLKKNAKIKDYRYKFF